MTTNEILILIAIFASPIIAVIITLRYGSIQEKRKQKMSLFMTLLANRKTYPIPTSFVDALNTIDVVFHNKKEVVSAWKSLFDSYHIKPFDPDKANKEFLNLLDAMANSLGYKKIKQTTLDSFYSPSFYTNQLLSQEELSKEILRVLKNSHSLGTPIQSDQNNQIQL
jgi:hypothetical protein